MNLVTLFVCNFFNTFVVWIPGATNYFNPAVINFICLRKISTRLTTQKRWGFFTIISNWN